MAKCKVCQRAKCVWVPLKGEPEKMTTAYLEKILSHNNDWIEMTYSGSSSADAEERAYGRLQHYAEEIDRRKISK